MKTATKTTKKLAINRCKTLRPSKKTAEPDTGSPERLVFAIAMASVAKAEDWSYDE
jgi:hypothetical protein